MCYSFVIVFLFKQFMRHWLNVSVTFNVGSCLSSRYVFLSERCLFATFKRCVVFMITVVSPLSALVIIMPLFVLRLWSACLSCFVRFGVEMIVLLWDRSYFMLSKQQSRSLYDLVESARLVLYLFLKAFRFAWVLLLIFHCSIFFV